MPAVVVSHPFAKGAKGWGSRLKNAGKGYQTRANLILRERMLDELRRA